MRGKPKVQPTQPQNLSLKTMELLLVNYKNLHNSMAHFKPCAEKQKFVTLIADLEADIELAESFPNTNTTQE
jgi:hypothetical protein